MTIVFRSLADQAFEVVRERILSTEILPLTAIRQELLAEELGISKIPLREALGRLEQQGLVCSHPNRGFYVPPLTAAEAEEVFALRLKIEPEAAAAGCLDADEVDREAVISAFAQMHPAPRISSLSNRTFHLALLRPGRRQITVQLVERLQVLAERYVRHLLEAEELGESEIFEHQAIFDAWMARDAAQVTELLSTHIGTTLGILRQQLGRIDAGEGGEQAVPQRARRSKK